MMANKKIVERVNKDGSHSWDVIVAYKRQHYRGMASPLGNDWRSRKADTLKTKMLREVWTKVTTKSQARKPLQTYAAVDWWL